MLLATILAFSVVAVALRLLGERLRNWALLATCALAVYFLQPSMPVRHLDYWLPTVTLALTVFAWLLVSSAETRFARENLFAGLLLVGVAFGVALTRYLTPAGGLIIPGRPPQTGAVVIALTGAALIAWLLSRIHRAQNLLLSAGIGLTLLLLLSIKLPSLTEWVSAGLRSIAGQSTALASAADIRWLGFSYIVFRIIHTLRDRQAGRLPSVNLREYVTYAVFFPALPAGPIDRLEHFTPQLRQPSPLNLEAGGQRLLFGLFKKFVIADSLALIALGPLNAAYVHTAGWTWLLVYAFSLQIYLDFSGYTDIAIGMGLLMGIRLPENFNRPYLRSNLTQFWNNWHMTLTNWFRAYYFNPLTRALRSKRLQLSPATVILATQVTTMALIGLWHGITTNFLLWGLWHGAGLFAQNRWSAWATPRLAPILKEKPRLRWALTAGGALLTFHYVSLGWVWFAIPDPALAWEALRRMVGLS
ncbi:MAG: MBOAT family O-acyltransferase [Anaerolineaceae bacterium]|jgi:D-alanyl-lipoteichoic acid acyltransferase DltB (MBOAT superfamily)